jgi:hypothetical protein
VNVDDPIHAVVIYFSTPIKRLWDTRSPPVSVM